MNNFRRTKIRRGSPRKPLSAKAKQHIVTGFGILLLILIIYYAGTQIFARLQSWRFIDTLSGIVGKNLITDEKNHTNILALGTGGEGHEGGDLTDTILLTSLDHTNKRVSMLSIPRDLYINSAPIGGGRINHLYEYGKAKWGSTEAIDFAKKEIEKIFDIPIHYMIKVDFKAFEEIVDGVGGIDVFVEKTIDDPFYPNKTFGYDPFFLARGNQHLDGKTALKYVRSRETTSDFNRSKRQHYALAALKNKAAALSILEKRDFIEDSFYSLRDHVETNMSIREIVSLADFARKWDSKNMVSATLNDDPSLRGGFLYTPPRDLYKGAFVLLPAGDNFDSVKLFAQIVLYGPPLAVDGIPVAIFNGTKTPGLAATAKVSFNRFGLGRIIYIGNTKQRPIEKTTWYLADNVSQEFDALMSFPQKLLPGEIVHNIPQEYIDAYYEKNDSEKNISELKIVLVVGTDMTKTVGKLDIFRNIVPLVQSTLGTSSIVQ